MGIPRELPFSREEYDARLAGVRTEMAANSLDLLLVHTPANLCYLTGFQTLNLFDYSCLFLPIDEAPFIQVLAMEEANVGLTSRLEVGGLHEPTEDPVSKTLSLLRQRGLSNRRVGFEADSPALTPQRFDSLREALPNLVPASNLIQRVLRIKSPAEIGRVRESARLTEAGMAAGIAAIGDGATDQDVAQACYAAMIGGGSEYMCIDPIVTTGRRSGVPHTTHKRKTIEPGDIVFIEIGACVERYSAPMMRTAVLGSPRAETVRTAEASFAGLDNAVAALKPGVSGDEVARAAWEGIRQDRSGLFFHGVAAYSIGLGFPPNWADYCLSAIRGEQTPLEAGMLFHLPIAIRDLGNYCVGFSETVLITEDGCEQLTQFERQLFCR